MSRRLDPTSTVARGSSRRLRYHAGWRLIPPCEATTTISSSPWAMYSRGTVRARPVRRPWVVSRQMEAPLGRRPAVRPLLNRYTTVLAPVIHCSATRPTRSWNALIGRARGFSTTAKRRSAHRQAFWASSVGQVAHDAVVARPSEDGVGGLKPREHGGLDATGIEAGVGPVAGEDQVVVAALVGPEPAPVRPRQGLHVPVRGVDVGGPVLRVERGGTGPPVAAAEKLPPEPGVAHGARQQVPQLLAEKV